MYKDESRHIQHVRTNSSSTIKKKSPHHMLQNVRKQHISWPTFRIQKTVTVACLISNRKVSLSATKLRTVVTLNSSW